MNKFSNLFRSEMTEQTNFDASGVEARFIFNFTVNLKIYVWHIKKDVKALLISHSHVELEENLSFMCVCSVDKINSVNAEFKQGLRGLVASSDA